MTFPERPNKVVGRRFGRGLQLFNLANSFSILDFSNHGGKLRFYIECVFIYESTHTRCSRFDRRNFVCSHLYNNILPYLCLPSTAKRGAAISADNEQQRRSLIRSLVTKPLDLVTSTVTRLAPLLFYSLFFLETLYQRDGEAASLFQTTNGTTQGGFPPPATPKVDIFYYFQSLFCPITRSFPSLTLFGLFWEGVTHRSIGRGAIRCSYRCRTKKSLTLNYTQAVWGFYSPGRGRGGFFARAISRD